MIVVRAFAYDAGTTGVACCRDRVGDGCTVDGTVAGRRSTRCLRVRITSCFAGIEMISVFAFAHSACTAGGACRRDRIGNR